MCRLILAEDGVFPIVRDSEGKPLVSVSDAGCDCAGTIQGEGKLVGVPSLFLRLGGCNLRCKWILDDGTVSVCDTAYASYETKSNIEMSVDKVYQLISNNLGNIRHLVITGGEPFLQAASLSVLCKKLKDAYRNIHITIETNGTIYDDKLADDIDLFSISPKLSFSLGGKKIEGLNRTVQLFVDKANGLKEKDYQLKFVTASDKHEAEIVDFLKTVKGWTNADILIMPAGTDDQMLSKSSKTALATCLKYGWRYCSRLHISLFGNKKGV